MQRYFLQTARPETNQVTISPEHEAFHHMSKVMRMQRGQQVMLVFQDAQAFLAELQAIDEVGLHFELGAAETQNKEMPVAVTIASGFPKGDKLEMIAQKATELGAHALIAFASTYAVAKWDQKKQQKKQERLTKIAREAAEQAHRQVAPSVQFCSSVKELIAEFDQYDAVFVAYEEAAKAGEVGQFVQLCQKVTPGQKVLAIFGPEGGLAPAEIEAFVAAGAVVGALGPRILRTETAPLYFLSAFSYACESLPVKEA